MVYLEDYCQALIDGPYHTKTDYDVYMETWKTFCHYAFNSPEVYYHLFFQAHSKSLDETVARYYEIFPEKLSKVSGPLHEMLRSGTIYSRNQKILAPLAEDGMIDAEDVDTINILTLCYLRRLLEEQCGPAPEEPELQTQRLLHTIQFLFKK